MDREQKAMKSLPKKTGRKRRVPQERKECDPNGETDVIICEDVISDAQREDLEIALRSVRPATHPAMINANLVLANRQDSEKGTPVPQPMAPSTGPKIINVRNITHKEFQQSRVNANGAVQQIQTVSATLSSGSDDSDDSDDSDIQIIEDIPKPMSVARALAPKATIIPQARTTNSVTRPMQLPVTQRAPIIRSVPSAMASGRIQPPPLVLQQLPSIPLQQQRYRNLVPSFGPPPLISHFRLIRPNLAPAATMTRLPPPVPLLPQFQLPVFKGGPLPIFGQNLAVSHLQHGAPAPKSAAKRQPTSSTKRKRRSSTSSSSSSSPSSSSGGSTGSDDGKRNQPKRRCVKPATKPTTASAECKVTMPRGYYGRSTYKRRRQKGDEVKCYFKCDKCDDVFTSNVDFVIHLYSHASHSPPEEDEFRNYKRCYECWREFDDPFQLMDHHEKVHEIRPDVDAVCHICELSFDDSWQLKGHMRRSHPFGLDMPYRCKICRQEYHSSLYIDVWNHFVTEHQNSACLMCPFCLATTDAKPKSAKSNTAETGSFLAHMRRHIENESRFSCRQCKLQFCSKSDMNKHQSVQHSRWLENGKVPPGSTGVSWDGFCPLQEIDRNDESLVSRKLQQNFGWGRQLAVADCICKECGRPMSDGHLAKRLQSCSVCKFSTFCIATHQLHSLEHGRGRSVWPFEYSPLPRRRESILPEITCKCGYHTSFGNLLAAHLSSCQISGGRVKIPPVEPPSFTQMERREMTASELSFFKSLGLEPKFEYSLVDSGSNGEENISSCADVMPKNSSKERCETPLNQFDQPGASTMNSQNRRGLLSPQTCSKRSDDEKLESRKESWHSKKMRKKDSLVPGFSYSNWAKKYDSTNQGIVEIQAGVSSEENFEEMREAYGAALDCVKFCSFGCALRK